MKTSAKKAPSRKNVVDPASRKRLQIIVRVVNGNEPRLNEWHSCGSLLVSPDDFDIRLNTFIRAAVQAGVTQFESTL